jgi:hypothetical protein
MAETAGEIHSIVTSETATVTNEASAGIIGSLPLQASNTLLSDSKVQGTFSIPRRTGTATRILGKSTAHSNYVRAVSARGAERSRLVVRVREKRSYQLKL